MLGNCPGPLQDPGSIMLLRHTVISFARVKVRSTDD